jgi:LAGLIDADG endonuclease
LLLLSLPVLAGDFFIVPALNLAICWKHFLKLIVESQSAGNLIYLDMLLTLREYKLEIICSNSILLNSNINSNFISYLTGLIEGDGTIIVPKTERSPKGKLNYPSIQIIFHKKDLPLALQIQKKLGTGSLISKKGVNAYTLYVNDKKGILNLVNLLNGQMRTPKINSLYNLIDWLNKKNPQLNLKKFSLNNKSLIKNAWLSGFIDSDGHFSVRTSFTGKYPKIECKFELSQRQRDQLGYNNKLFLNTIAKFLNVNLKNIRENTSHPQYRLRTTNLKSNLTLINYLNKFPLFGSKYLDYKDWGKILNLFNPRFKYTQENINNVLSLKSEMNDKRAVFTWNHLNKFY